MARLALACVVGLAAGFAIFWWLRPASAPTTPSTLVAAQTPSPLGPQEVDPTAIVARETPGLRVLVKRGRSEVADADVELFVEAHAESTPRWRSTGREKTDAAGSATFPTTTGAHLVHVHLADGTDAVQAFTIPEAPIRHEVVVLLEPARVVTGTVKDERGQPVPQSVVRAVLPGAPNLTLASAGVDSLGRFSLSVAPFDRWELVASAPGWLPTPKLLSPSDEPVEFILLRGVIIDGRVEGLDGAPVGSASVQAAPSALGSADTSTDGEGHFSLLVPSGSVSFFASAADGRQGLERTLHLEPGLPRRVVIRVASGDALRGVVTDGAGPRAKVHVRISSEPDAVQVARLESDAAGRFEAHGLPAGRYSILADDGQGGSASQVGVEVPQVSPLELQLSASGSLAGVVVDEDGQTLPGATVTVSWSRGIDLPDRSTRTDAFGRFSFQHLTPSEVGVVASVDGHPSATERIYVAPGADLEMRLQLTVPGHLIGTITGHLKVNEVLLSSESAGSISLHARVVGGRFELSLPAGRYVVFPMIETGFHSVEEVTVRAGETTTAAFDWSELADANAAMIMHGEAGSGLSFDDGPGGVLVDFLMNDCPAAKAGARIGDLVVAIDGAPPHDALDAFAKVRRPSVELTIRREGRDVALHVQ